MKKNKKVLAGVVVVLLSSLFMGALIKKSEASLSVIKAGVDERGNPLCVNKNQVYLFCYDYGFLVINQKGPQKYLLVEWQEYMKK